MQKVKYVSNREYVVTRTKQSRSMIIINEIFFQSRVFTSPDVHVSIETLNLPYP
jgi:hypothetical protein